MKTITHNITRPCSTSQHYHEPMRVTLSAMPFDVPSGPDETAPRSAPIRGETNWKRDKLLAMASRIR
jgi:hypothetical protein